MATVKKVCRSCKETFIIEDREQEWYIDQGYDLPNYCFRCRRERRLEKLSDKETPLQKETIVRKQNGLFKERPVDSSEVFP